MNYHPLINGTNRQKLPKNDHLPNGNLGASRNGQRHVTFRGVNQSQWNGHDSANNQKYHFTYGQPYHEGMSFVSHSKSGLNNQSFQANNIVRDQMQNPQNRMMSQQIYQNLSEGMLRDRSSSSSKKKKLRIFPQKYDTKANSKAPASTSKDSNPTQAKQIAQLKSQIQHLRQEITTLSLNLSKNTSRDFSQSLYRNEADRTKRLSELKQFNEELYHRLALKLKQISVEEYENVLQINNSNKKFLDSVYSSAGKQRAWQTVGYQKPLEQNKFMDINEFQKEYQERFSQPRASPSKLLVEQSDKDKEEAQSPFLIRENTIENTIENDGFKTIQPNPTKNIDKREAFTFHKKYAQKTHKIPKPQQKPIDPSKQTQLKVFDIESQTKEKRQLHDMNRELENKIWRKRSASEYAYLAKTRKY